MPASATITMVGLAATAVAAGALAASRRKAAGSTTSKAQSAVVAVKAFENELGVQEPIGFWDPAGFTSDGNEENFRRRRVIEIKHGRVSMIATIGYIVPQFVGKWPGELSPSSGIKFADVPNGLAAFSKVPVIGWAQIFGFCGAVEAAWGFDRGNKPGQPGDYGWKAISKSDPAEKKRSLAAEIANGRLAMMAIIGMFFQDGLTGEAWGDWDNYKGSLVMGVFRAFESELGVQPPVGFWDPLGLASDGDVAQFKRRRTVELKHGRVSMIASIGYILPEYVKFPGYLSPSAKLKFADVPNGLAALSKVPAAGKLQWFAFCGAVEFFWGVQYRHNWGMGDALEETPGDYGWKAITAKDDAGRTRKLNAELANGRLAMMAIIGMFYQDGLCGSAWGSWDNYVDSPLR